MWSWGSPYNLLLRNTEVMLWQEADVLEVTLGCVHAVPVSQQPQAGKYTGPPSAHLWRGPFEGMNA